MNSAELAAQRNHTARVIEEITEKRLCQVTKHGYGALHDDGHDYGELALAAIAYAAPAPVFVRDDFAAGIMFKDPFPWTTDCDRRPYVGNTVKDPGKVPAKKRRELLITACAWLVAEIERIDRELERLEEETHLLILDSEAP